MAKAGRFDAIVHGCNCFHTMGAGIAKSIRTHFPEAYQTDLQTEYGSYEKLGTISQTEIKGFVKPFIVVNAYTQHRYGRSKRHTDYEAVARSFELIGKQFQGLNVGYPKLGCVNGGGDWNIVSKIIDEKLEGCQHFLVTL